MNDRHSKQLEANSNYIWRILNQTNKINLLILLFDIFLPPSVELTHSLVHNASHTVVTKRFAFEQQLTNDTIRNYILMNSTLIQSIVCVCVSTREISDILGCVSFSWSQFNLMWIEWNTVTSGFWCLMFMMNGERSFIFVRHYKTR